MVRFASSLLSLPGSIELPSFMFLTPYHLCKESLLRKDFLWMLESFFKTLNFFVTVFYLDPRDNSSRSKLCGACVVDKETTTRIETECG